MANEHLVTYLHDHLAGSVVAIELLEHLEQAHGGTDLAPFFATLRQDVLTDRAELDALIGRVGGSPGTVRGAVGWLAEKAARLKLRVDDAPGGDFRLLEAAELVAVGIEGKRSLWAALAEVAAAAPELRGPDYAALVARAAEQRQRIERVRLRAARSALGPTRIQ
ncbi:hypothetical protein [Gemmata sp.]|uniref:hypothetical protein n=1 Tax=Gemmata sp. TaxID=1914242 RepID=UPI003F71D333